MAIEQFIAEYRFWIYTASVLVGAIPVALYYWGYYQGYKKAWVEAKERAEKHVKDMGDVYRRIYGV